MSAKYRRIHREEGNRPVQSVCRWVEVSGSGCCDRRNRPRSSTARRGEDPAAVIVVEFFDESERACGCRRVHAGPARGGVEASRSAWSAGSWRRRVRLPVGLGDGPGRIVPAPDFPGRPDRLRRDFTATAPGMKWVGGIAHGPIRRGFAYLAVVVDCFPGGVVGRAIAGRMRVGLVAGALAMAVRNCPPIRGVTVFHSGRGARCTSAEYAKFMAGRGVLPSVGRTGSCYGNAVAESFNAILKKELVNRKVYSTRNHAIRDVTAWIELRYNHKRLHSAIDYQTPNQVDTEWRQQHKAAA